MLQNRVKIIPGLDHTPSATCLYATVYWIYEDLHGVSPTAAIMSDILIKCTFNRIFTDMMRAGKKVSRPMAGSLNLAPGTVLIFEKNGGVGHGCVVKSATVIGGYNQTNWFSTPGIAHSYSQHHPNDISWRGALHPTDVNINVVLPPFPPDPKWGKLYQLDQGKARDILFRHESTMQG